MISYEKLLTVREFAFYLKIKEATVRKWINEGKLNAIKIGKEYRIKTTELNDLIND